MDGLQGTYHGDLAQCNCDTDLPYIITQVSTTKASVSDIKKIGPIHNHLKEKERLPKSHLVDTGYIDASNLLESEKKYGVDLVGPNRKDENW